MSGLSIYEKFLKLYFFTCFLYVCLKSKRVGIKNKILGVGGYLPDRVVSNFDLEKIVDTSDEWITKRTGIHNRHIADEKQSTSDLAVEAIKKAILNAKIDTNDIDMIICATTTPDLTFPSTACIIQQKLGLNKTIIAFDIQAVCSGFVYAVSIANDMMKNGKIKNAVVVGAEKMSSIIDWNDRTTCVLFGDGAGAVVLSSNNNEERSGIIDTELCANGNFNDILFTNGGVSGNFGENSIRDFEGNVKARTSGAIKMNGQGVFKHAVEKMTSSIKEIVEINGYKIDDVKLIIPHQANYRILSLVAEKLEISDEKFMLTIGEHANTSSASIPLALDVAIQKKKIEKGDLVVFEALGGGLTWGSILLRL